MSYYVIKYEFMGRDSARVRGQLWRNFTPGTQRAHTCAMNTLCLFGPRQSIKGALYLTHSISRESSDRWVATVGRGGLMRGPPGEQTSGSLLYCEDTPMFLSLTHGNVCCSATCCGSMWTWQRGSALMTHAIYLL